MRFFVVYFVNVADAPLIPVQGYSRRSQNDPYNERQPQHDYEMQVRYPPPSNAKA